MILIWLNCIFNVFFLLIIRGIAVGLNDMTWFTVKVSAWNELGIIKHLQLKNKRKNRFSKTVWCTGVGHFCPAWPAIMPFSIYADDAAAGVCTAVPIDTCPSSDSVIVRVDESARWLHDLVINTIIKERRGPSVIIKWLKVVWSLTNNGK